MKCLLRLCGHRKSRRELLSTSEASWATTKSDGMWLFSPLCNRQGEAPVLQGDEGALPRICHPTHQALLTRRAVAVPLLQAAVELWPRRGSLRAVSYLRILRSH